MKPYAAVRNNRLRMNTDNNTDRSVVSKPCWGALENLQNGTNPATKKSARPRHQLSLAMAS